MNNMKIDSFFKRKACEIEREERDEEIIIPTSESETVLENPTIEEHHGFENSLESVLRFGNIHQIKWMQYE
jgi:hypothetical protein